MAIRTRSVLPRGHRRAGVRHSATPTTWPARTFTAAQLEQLRADPFLVVEDVAVADKGAAGGKKSSGGAAGPALEGSAGDGARGGPQGSPDDGGEKGGPPADSSKSAKK